MSSLVLPRSFFERDTLEVARDLIGCQIHRTLPEALGGDHLIGQITEAEAYRGALDDAAHTFRGKTPRNQVMFGPPGHAYVYFIYGMHWNMNVVTRPEGFGEGVLLRGLIPVQGEEKMVELRGRPKPLADGPGKLTQALGITGDDYGWDMTRGQGLYFTERTEPVNIRATPRIGIDYATDAKDAPWRFIDANHRRK